MAQTDYRRYQQQMSQHLDDHYYHPDENIDMAYPYPAASRGGQLGGQYIDYHQMGPRGKDPGYTNGNQDGYVMAGGGRGGRGIGHYQVEHLASFPQDGRSGFISPVDALNRLKRISSGNGLWAQVMSMTVTNEIVAMANGETMEPIEEYPLEQISLCTHVMNDPVFENLLIFTTKLSRDKVGAVHLFQCRSGEAPVISNDINRRMKKEEPNGYHDNLPSPREEFRQDYPPPKMQPVSDPYVPPNYRREPEPVNVNGVAPHSIAYERGYSNEVSNAGPYQREPVNQSANVREPVNNSFISREQVNQNPVSREPPAQRVTSSRDSVTAYRESSSQQVYHRESVTKEPSHKDLEPADSRPQQRQEHVQHVAHPRGHVVSSVVHKYEAGDIKDAHPIVPANPVVRNSSLSKADYPADDLSPLEDAKINRDVEVLNHCIEEIENFVILLKRTSDARKLLKDKKKKKGKKYEILKLQAQGPPEFRITDITQKFKHSFNLLGRLRPHISRPNSPELVHYLMVPLHIITQVVGLEKVVSVINPLLTIAAIDLLGNCLSSEENHFWQSLGLNWTQTKSSPEFRDKYLPPYQPIFSDGWVAPEIVANEKEDAAARSAAAMIARIKDNGLNRYGYEGYPAIARSGGEGQVKSFVEVDEEVQRKTSRDGVDVAVSRSSSKASKQEYQITETAVTTDRQFSRESNNKVRREGSTKSVKQAVVVYDYTAHNNKELTIRSGETVVVLDDSRRWWLVRNTHNEQGFVPSTVLEIPREAESSDSSSLDGSGPPSPPSTGYNTAVVQTVAYNNNNNNSSFNNYNNNNVTNNNNSSFTSPIYAKAQKSTVIERERKDEAVQVSEPIPVIIRQPDPPVVVPPFQREQSTTSVSTQYNIVPAPPPPPPVQFSSVVPPPPPPPPPPPELPPVIITVPVPKAAPKPAPKPTNKHGSENLQSELRNRLSTNNTLTAPSYPSSVDIDGVEVFIPLYKSSTADDVSRWLRKLRFTDRTVSVLHGIVAKELFKMTKDSLLEKLGDNEGLRLYEELLVQAGAHTKHKTMTEFQKVLLERMQKREGSDKNRSGYQPTSPKSPTTPSPTSPTSPTSPASALTQDELQRKYEEQQALIKKQQEELERLKGREPDKPTFSSFNGSGPTFNFTSQSVHGKTKF